MCASIAEMEGSVEGEVGDQICATAILAISTKGNQPVGKLKLFKNATELARDGGKIFWYNLGIWPPLFLGIKSGIRVKSAAYPVHVITISTLRTVPSSSSTS